MGMGVEKTNFAIKGIKTSMKAELKMYFEEHIKDPYGVKFALDIFDISFDLVLNSIQNEKKGKTLTKSDLMLFFANRALATIPILSTQAQVACATSVMQIGLDLVTNSEMLTVPLVGYAAYIAIIANDALDASGNCLLAWQDYQVQRLLAEADKHLNAKRMLVYGQAVCAVKDGREPPFSIGRVIQRRRTYAPSSSTTQTDASAGAAGQQPVQMPRLN